jgi:hypothetical protein
LFPRVHYVLIRHSTFPYDHHSVQSRTPK